uniref:Selenoprotein P N-terminal domain-containing protein n=2 Tax=Sparus aurata TaxID=8175 RepID=A0A671WY03_SPAAU
MIVNEREAQSRAMYWELKRRAPSGVPVYQQAPLQDDVWEALDGDKDDFLVYDRCGRLTFHIVLPYSFLHYPYVEAAIRATYHKNICNCSDSEATAQNGTMKNGTTAELDTEDPEVAATARHHSHLHHHPHHSKHSHHNHTQHQHVTIQNQTLNPHSPSDHPHHPQHHHPQHHQPHHH